MTAEHRHAHELAQERNARRQAEAALQASEAAAVQAQQVALATHNAAVRGMLPGPPPHAPMPKPAIPLSGGGTLTFAAAPQAGGAIVPRPRLGSGATVALGIQELKDLTDCLQRASRSCSQIKRFCTHVCNSVQEEKDIIDEARQTCIERLAMAGYQWQAADPPAGPSVPGR